MDIKQRVEIISSDLDALKVEVEQGGGSSDSYTKAEADDKFAEKTSVYTKSEADNKFVEQANIPLTVSGDIVKTSNATGNQGILIGNQAGNGNAEQIAIGVRASTNNIGSGVWPIAIGYQTKAYGNSIAIGSYTGTDVGSSATENVLIGPRIDARGDGYSTIIGSQAKGSTSTVSIGKGAGEPYAQASAFVGTGCKATNAGSYYTAIGNNNTVSNSNAVAVGHNLTAHGKQVVMGQYNVDSNTQNSFVVGNGSDSNNLSNLVEITTPFKVSTAGIEANGAFYTSTASSTETLPGAGTGTTFDTGIEWAYIQTMNDFILDSNSTNIKFRYGYTEGTKLHYFGYIVESSTTKIAHLELGAPTGSGTTALATWISSGAIPTT